MGVFAANFLRKLYQCCKLLNLEVVDKCVLLAFLVLHLFYSIANLDRILKHAVKRRDSIAADFPILRSLLIELECLGQHGVVFVLSPLCGRMSHVEPVYHLKRLLE